MLLKASSHIVFDGIQWYCNTLVQPYGNTWVRFWILANTLNTVKYRVLQIELVSIHNTVKYPWQPLVTVGNHMVTHQITLNAQIIFFLQRTRSSNKRWRPHLFETIHSVYSNKSHQNTNIPATTVGNPNTIKYPGIWWYLGCHHQIPNTVKYCQILHVYEN